jgi:hypothetical protein
MAISDSSKVDLLWKKVAFGVSKTDTAAAKSGSNETVASPLPVYANQIWAQASEIPASAPGSTTGVVQFYGGAQRVQGVADATATLNTTWKTNLSDWVPATFDANYSIKVYVGDPQAAGVQIFPDTNTQEYVFDYQSGTLHFLNTLPANISTAGIYFVGYRYVGTKGLTGAGAGSKNQVVANIAARDALTGMSSGDTVFVTDASGIPADAGAGEYAVYMWDGSVWRLTATQDAANEDSRTSSVALTSASTGTVSFVRAGNGSRIVSCSVDVTTAFDGTFDITVGTAGDNSLVMSVNDHDVASIGAYVVTPTMQLNLSAETQLNVYVTGTATVGNAVVTLTYA